MLPVANKFDVYVTGPGAEAARATTLARLVELYPLGAQERAIFGRGERTLLRKGVSSEDGQRIATSVRALGMRVDIEAQASGFGMVELDSYTQEEARAPAAAASGSLFGMGSVGLMDLDGSDPRDSEPSPTAAPSSGGPLLGGLFGGSLRDEDEPLAGDGRPRQPPAPAKRAAAPPPTPRGAAPPPIPRAAAPPPPVAPQPPPRPAAVAAPASPFRPAGSDSSANELALDRPPPDPMLSMPSSKPESFEVPRCPTHDIPRQHGRCPRCDAEDSEFDGRLFGGSLHAKPTLRLVIGLGGGLLLGWMVTSPMARRAERHVEYIREEARREHARPLEEAQDHAAVLDKQAEDEASSGFTHTLAVWALITSAVTAGWFRLT